MLTVQELIPNEEYEAQRPQRRQQAMSLKDRRRIEVGDYLTFLFENHDTLLYQVQEIMRSEKLHRAEDLENEVRVYNEQMPTPGTLSACLFVNVTQQEKIRAVMAEMVGLDEPGRVKIVVDGHEIAAEFEGGRSKENRISALQYVKFSFSPSAMQSLASAADVKLVVDHPHYKAQAVVGQALRSEWLKDLMGKY